MYASCCFERRGAGTDVFQRCAGIRFQELKIYGLRSNVDLTFLNDREVTQVAIGLYQVIFHFDEDASISVEGEFEYSDDQATFIWNPGALRAAGNVAALLGAKIVSVAGQGNGTILLLFSNGARLTIRDSSTEHESYTISRPGVTIVV